MTVSILTRERGTVMRCNGCGVTCTTASIRKSACRAYGATLGWIRGLDPGSGTPLSEGGRPSNTRNDYCPTCANVERSRYDVRKAVGAARRARRAELAKLSPEERMAERRRVKNAASKQSRDRKKQTAGTMAEMADRVFK
jgi:Zn-finger nucleic acid-binding protein